ncbi:Homeobox protein onecut [Trichinella zimbabwensis]|uniref:Homeobox protein onecut n=1 Tax=Trichinella zimbabwensis TaxID=268475 RepID=A0A0V1HGL5_9BILA|nr:Homeobox protein onecut [Trichinella zimbabwensis]
MSQRTSSGSNVEMKCSKVNKWSSELLLLIHAHVDWLIGLEASSTLTTTTDWVSFKLYGFDMTIGKCGYVGRAVVEYLFNFYTMLEQVLENIFQLTNCMPLYYWLLRLWVKSDILSRCLRPGRAYRACKRKEEQQQQGIHTPGPKKPRLVFTDIQRRTLQAIFKETKRPSKEMQVTIAQQLGLDVSTVANFFMNARRRGADRWKDNDSNGSRVSMIPLGPTITLFSSIIPSPADKLPLAKSVVVCFFFNTFNF